MNNTELPMSEKQRIERSVPTTMSAVRVHAAKDPQRPELEFERVATPRPRAGEALVCVHAAAITRGELEWPADRLPAIPSYEFSGVVAALGSGVEHLQVGDPVYALSGFDRDGAAAEYTVVKAEVLAPKPRTLSHIESAAIPLAALAAWQALFDHGDLKAGQRVLIHGAAGVVGSFAVQLAHERGAHVIGTASGDGVEVARQLGADEVIDNKTTRFELIVQKIDVVLDTIGGDMQTRSLALLPRGGKLVSIATEPSKERAADYGVTAIYFVVEPNRDQLVEITKLVEENKLRPTVADIFPLADARAAFERIRGGQRGKMVLVVVDDVA
jgi:NADPH:quinone reductase-like Zn-dependent oxidoreductase